MMTNKERKALISLRQETGLPMVQCKAMLEKVNYDVEKALELHLPTPVDEEEDNIPFYSKEETDDHFDHLTCPHCDKEFWCRGFGGYAG